MCYFHTNCVSILHFLLFIVCHFCNFLRGVWLPHPCLFHLLSGCFSILELLRCRICISMLSMWCAIRFSQSISWANWFPQGLMQDKIGCIAIQCQYMKSLTLLCDHLDSNVSADLKRGWSNCFPRSCNRSHCLDIHCPQIFACRKTSNDHDEFSVCKILNLLILNLQLTNIDS